MKHATIALSLLLMVSCADHDADVLRQQLSSRDAELKAAKIEIIEVRRTLDLTRADLKAERETTDRLRKQLTNVETLLSPSVVQMPAKPAPPVQPVQQPTVVRANIDPMLRSSREELPPREASVERPKPATSDQGIIDFCTREWGSDYRMLVYCESQQQSAKDTLDSRNWNAPINLSVYRGIQRQCAAEWGGDYRMREYCENKQIDAYRQTGGN